MLREIRSYATGHIVLADWDHIGRILSERERARQTPAAGWGAQEDTSVLRTECRLARGEIRIEMMPE